MKFWMALMALTIGLHAADSGAAILDFHCGKIAKQKVGANIGDDSLFVLVSDSTKSNFVGMSCQDLKSTMDMLTFTGIVIMPASLLTKMSGVTLAGELEAAGLAVGGTAIVAVTAIFGSVVYIAMKASLQECEKKDREQLKRDIIQELKQNFGFKPSGDVKFEIQHDGGNA